MKKLLSVFLCLILTLSIIPVGMTFNVNAASYEQIGANQTWRNSWDGSQKYVYLTVDQTGYYDLNIKDFQAEAAIVFYIKDMEFNDDDDSWYNTYDSFNNYVETYDRENIYLIKNHLYEIKVAYGDYDEYDNFVNFYADLSITFTRTSYAPIEFSLGNNKNLFIGYNTYDWLEFKTSTSGDYTFTLNDYADFNLDIYEKISGTHVKFTYFDYYKTTRLNLKSNTEYIIKTSSGEKNDRLVRLNISKALNNVTSVDLIQSNEIWAEDNYLNNQKLYLNYSDYSSFQYTVTYSDASKKIFNFEELRENGISVDDVIYIGEFDKCYTGECFLRAGKQPVKIVYMGGKTATSSIDVTSYVDWLISVEASAITDFEDLRMTYTEDYNDDGYWLINPDETNSYDIYSSEWHKLDIDFFIFDKNNALIPYREGYNLKAGNLYALKGVCTFNDYYSEGFYFHYEPNRDHIHSYMNACDADCNICGNTRAVTHFYKTTTDKATTSKNGSIVKKCSICGQVASETIIKYAKTFKLSTTSYTYNGDVKTPSVTVKDSAGNTLKKNTDYTVTYESGRKNVGTYKVTIKMIGKYSGTKTLTFEINPDKTTVSKLTAGKKRITVEITKKSTQVAGYQIQYSTSKKFTSAKTKTITSYNTTKYTLKSLSAKKTYYVRVRTYKTVGKTKYYSGWSTYKHIKTK